MYLLLLVLSCVLWLLGIIRIYSYFQSYIECYMIVPTHHQQNPKFIITIQHHPYQWLVAYMAKSASSIKSRLLQCHLWDAAVLRIFGQPVCDLTLISSSSICVYKSPSDDNYTICVSSEPPGNIANYSSWVFILTSENKQVTAPYKCSPLQWRHDERDGVSNYQPHHCLLKRLFGRRSKKTSKLRVTGLCEGNSPGTGEFPAQRTSNAENVSIWWRYVPTIHILVGCWYVLDMGYLEVTLTSKIAYLFFDGYNYPRNLYVHLQK